VDADLKEQGHCKGWMMGGGTLASSFLQAGLITELQLFTMPMLLGRGIGLFRNPLTPVPLKLRECRAESNGVVFRSYRIA
jgi:dihydrofolate reductase